MNESQGRVYIVCTKLSGRQIIFDLRKIVCFSSVAHPDSHETPQEATEVILEAGGSTYTYLVQESATGILEAVSEALGETTPGSQGFGTTSWQDLC